ncbi:hypothetical protein HanXRQr2_Chr01g0007091 [Helianthus annuus]|uniref:Uncharacterized protein n=1 Tax=Helianthus annuus TaxID=4232 RepID=A0A9K3P3D3_HELAN|nr:hypothetical protein HanXRQr2_Chr01g0007091 [Helianthus annuus]KAJ0930999.1 hypothetical protein HanPSC8_Chr04g0156231 [Helianthus annuus]
MLGESLEIILELSSLLNLYLKVHKSFANLLLRANWIPELLAYIRTQTCN